MKNTIPCLYAEYGRYISRFRSIQLYIDCLIPVERRLLLSLHDVAKPKPKKRVKSAKVVGYCIGSYHPHGDISAYGSLVQLARKGFADPKGNFGHENGRDSVSAAGQRYTEIRAEKVVDDLISENLNFVPWANLEGMDAEEPIYFSTIVPLGLIGHGFHYGMTFYSSIVPRYNYIDLCTRLKHLLDGGDPKHNIIKPSIPGCIIQESGLNDYYDILTKGTGSLIISPITKINKSNIEILGKSPGGGFKTLINKACRPSYKIKKNKADKVIELEKGNPLGEYYIIDLSKSTHTKVIIEPRRGINLSNLYTTIKKYITKNIYILCNFVDHETGKVRIRSIDELLLVNYQIYIDTCLLKYQDKLNKLLERKFECDVIAQVIRPIFKQYKCNTIADVINYYKKSPLPNISEQDITNICSKKSIKQLIEYKLDVSSIISQIQTVKNDIININTIIYDKLEAILK